MVDELALKLACLRLAEGDTARAKDLYDFVRGRGKYSDGALKGYAPDDGPANAKARVVGRDGKLEPPFSDYLKE